MSIGRLYGVWFVFGWKMVLCWEMVFESVCDLVVVGEF